MKERGFVSQKSISHSDSFISDIIYWLNSNVNQKNVKVLAQDLTLFDYDAHRNPMDLHTGC